ncbi:MAG: ABC transporter ATP-binding protein [Candidatus Marinimicrobia bacterium]|nr:ABC transporter ATP-binding protein [Candidatus Neomarinimicrobiota bacterium]
MLELNNISKRFDGVNALAGLSLKIQPGQITALIGPNGSGKTTAFNIITGFLRPNEGRVYFKQQNITGVKPFHIARFGIGHTFQNIRLFPQISVLDNVLLALKYPRGEKLWPAIIRAKNMLQEESANIKKAQELLDFVGLFDKQAAFAEHMSHGQRRLLELARAMALDPELLLLDEPMAGLSPVMVEQMKDHIKKVRNGGKTILFISHDMDVVMDISDQVIVINYGKKIAAGTPPEIQNNEAVLNAYLGKKHLA